MLNIGIIGNTEVLEPHVKRIQKNKNINVIGKASVGTSAQLNGFHFSIPELNRVELIERADILLVDNSSRLAFEMLCGIVKKSKHIFTTEYLNISVDECEQLVKLANESGSVVQVTNPHFYSPQIKWLNDNITAPLFLNISRHVTETIFSDALYPLLLMLLKITGVAPKKIGVSAFKSENSEITFSNIRLEFNNASVVNINLGNQVLVDEFKIEVYSENQSISLNFNNEIFLLNDNPIDFKDYSAINEYDIFIDSIQNKTLISSSFEDYHVAMQLVDSIEKKIAQFIAQ